MCQKPLCCLGSRAKSCQLTPMSLLSEVREDIRLARLNNPNYGFLFRLIDVVSVLVKVVAVALFSLGILHIIYDFDAPHNTNSAQPRVSALERTAEVDTAAIIEPEMASLSPERVEMLRQFAVANRDTATAEFGANVAGSADTGEAMIAKVNIPEAIVDQSEQIDQNTAEISIAGDIVPLPVDTGFPQITDSLTLNSKAVLGALENRMQAALDGGGSGQLLEPSDPQESDSVAPTLVEDNDGLKDAAWIRARNPDHYTIQIGSTLNRPFLVTFAGQLPSGEPISIYHYVFRDRPEYGLSYGLFDSIEEAKLALDALSPRVRRYGAFPRKLSIVHQQIDQAPKQLVAAEK